MKIFDTCFHEILMENRPIHVGLLHAVNVDIFAYVYLKRFRMNCKNVLARI